MKMLRLPNTPLTVSNIMLGMMRLNELDDAGVRRLVDTALDVGITAFDHADVYGGAPHACERRFGEAAGIGGSRRDSVVLQSKVGIRPGFFDFSREHILASVDDSLAALGTDHLDVLLLHRPDALVEPEEVAGAFDALHEAGKVRAFGVSNHTPGQIELLKTAVRQPLVVDQLQLGLAHAPMIASGIAANMAGLDQSADRDNGIVDYCRVLGVRMQAWSPLQAGDGRGTFLGDREHYPELNRAIDEVAAAHGVPAVAVATGWITRHPADIQVVLGTTNPQRLRNAALGSDLALERAEWYRLFTAAGYTLP